MLSEEVVMRIRELIAEGKLSYTQIAKKLKVGRRTVGRCSNPNYQPGVKFERRKQATRERKSAREKEEAGLPIVVNPDSAEFNHVSKVEYHRCPGCGSLVQERVRCLACAQRELLADQHACYFNELLRPSPNLGTRWGGAFSGGRSSSNVSRSRKHLAGGG